MTSPLRILIFAPAFAPLTNPEAIVNAKLARAFLDRGWSVDVVARGLVGVTDYDYGAAWHPSFVPLRERTHEVRYPRGSPARRALETASGALRTRHLVDGCRWASHALRVAAALHETHPYDVILSRALPDSAHLPAMALGRAHGIPWIANWNDPGGKRMPPPYGEGPDAAIGFWEDRLLRNTVRRAARLTFPSARLRDYMCRYLGAAAAAKSTVIPHVGAAPSPRPRARSNERFTIAYAGNVTRERSPSAFLAALRRVVSGLAPGSLEFQFIGRDVTGALAAATPELQGWIRIVGPRPYDACQELLARADLLLLLEADAPESVFLPSKLVDYAESGTPILALTPRESTVRDHLRECGGGAAVEGDDVDGIARALLRSYEEWRSGAPGERATAEALHARFRPREIVDLYAALFRDLGLAETLTRSNG